MASHDCVTSALQTGVQTALGKEVRAPVCFTRLSAKHWGGHWVGRPHHSAQGTTSPGDLSFLVYTQAIAT